MAFPPKKKPGMDVMVAVAPHRGAPGKGDLSGPGPLGGPPPKKKAGFPPVAGDDEPDDAAGPDDAGMDDESSETPGYESTEEQGAKLISDIEQAGEKHGLDGATARSFAADVFSAMADCLRGGGEGAGEEQEGGDEMGGSPYGR